MNIGEICATAGIYTVLGMGTVFCILILISIIIWLLGVLTGGAKSGQKNQEQMPAPVKAAVPAQAGGATAEDLSADTALVAVIMAAIKAYNDETSTEEDDDAYVVRSIRRATWKHTQSE